MRLDFTSGSHQISRLQSQPLPQPPPLPERPHRPPMGDDCAINELLEGRMDLDVILPDDRKVRLTVDRRTPMMDLLVQAASATKISPAGHTIHVFGDKDGALHYKPSTPIGSLDANTICIVPRKEDAAGRRTAPKVANRPFEPTFRVQVHLPRNQLTVTRVSPRVTVSQLRSQVCREKGLDPLRYQLVRPSDPGQPLDGEITLAEYGSTEITLLSNTCVESHMCSSTSHITSYPKRADERKTGILRLLAEDSQIKACKPTTTPHPQTTTATDAPHPRCKPKKRRPAPPPPVLSASEPSFHSRQSSSDSSGYHEVASSSYLQEPSADEKASSDSSGVSSIDAKVTSSVSVAAVEKKKRKAPMPPSGGEIDAAKDDNVDETPPEVACASEMEKENCIQVDAPVTNALLGKHTSKGDEAATKVALVALNARIEQNVTEQQIASSIEAAFHDVQYATNNTPATVPCSGINSAATVPRNNTSSATVPRNNTSSATVPSTGNNSVATLSCTDNNSAATVPCTNNNSAATAQCINNRAVTVPCTESEDEEECTKPTLLAIKPLKESGLGICRPESTDSSVVPKSTDLICSSNVPKSADLICSSNGPKSTDLTEDNLNVRARVVVSCREAKSSGSNEDKLEAGVKSDGLIADPKGESSVKESATLKTGLSDISRKSEEPSGLSNFTFGSLKTKCVSGEHNSSASENNLKTGHKESELKNQCLIKTVQASSANGLSNFTFGSLKENCDPHKKGYSEVNNCSNVSVKKPSPHEQISALSNYSFGGLKTESEQKNENRHDFQKQTLSKDKELNHHLKKNINQKLDDLSNSSINLQISSVRFLPNNQKSEEPIQLNKTVVKLQPEFKSNATETKTSYPLQKSSATSNFEAEDEEESLVESFPPPPTEFRNSSPKSSSCLRRASSLLNLVGPTALPAPSRGNRVRNLQRSLSDLSFDDRNEFEAEQQRLQREYAKLQRQFLLWQQQLVSNHAMLSDADCLQPPQLARQLRQSHSLPEGEESSATAAPPLVSRSLSYEPTRTLPRSTINIPSLELGSNLNTSNTGSNTLRSSKTKSYFKPPQVRISTKNRQRLPPEIRKDGDLDIYDDKKILSTILPTFDSLKLISENEDGDPTSIQDAKNQKKIEQAVKLEKLLNGGNETTILNLKNSAKSSQEEAKKIPPPVPSKTASLPKQFFGQNGQLVTKNGHCEKLATSKINGVNGKTDSHIQAKVNGVDPPPTPPMPANGQVNGLSRTKLVQKKTFEKRIDPREQLMQEIRKCGGRTALRKISLT